jgi:hypothetical protein
MKYRGSIEDTQRIPRGYIEKNYRNKEFESFIYVIVV